MIRSTFAFIYHSKQPIMAKMLFDIPNTFSLFAWILLIVFPNWKYTFTLLSSGWIVLLALTYTFIMVPGLGNFSMDAFGSIEGVRGLFQNDLALTAGWIHYLAFDLLIGCLIVQQSQKQGIPRWLYSLCLPFAFMFGPIGFLLYKIISFKYPKTEAFL